MGHLNPFTDPDDGAAGLVDQSPLSEAYDTVKAVYNNLPEIDQVAAVLDGIDSVVPLLDASAAAVAAAAASEASSVNGYASAGAAEVAKAAAEEQANRAEGFVLTLETNAAGGFYDSLAAGVADTAVAVGEAFNIIEGGRHFVGRKTGASTGEIVAEYATLAEAADARDRAEAARLGAESARDLALDYGSAKIYATWAELAAVTGMAAGDVAQVVSSDTGTHTDPVVGGTVPNAGVFRYSASPAGWQRIANLESDVAKAWAEGTLPGGAGTKSAKEHAADASGFADLALAARGQLFPFETLDTALGQNILVLDDADKLIATIPDPADQAILDAAVITDTFETLDAAPGVLLLDADDKQLVPADEATPLVNAAGAAETLADRLSRALTPYGAPLQADYLPKGAYRNVRGRLRRLRNGEATQCVMAFAGDSWIDGDTYWLRQFSKGLQDAYGFGGLGWFGFSYFGTATGAWVDGGTQPTGGGGCSRGDLASVAVFSGTWTSVNGTGALATPNMGSVSTSEAGAYLRMSFPAGHTGCDLFYAGDGTGVIDYSWDGGSSWTTLSLTSIGPTRVALAGTPSGAGTLRIRRNAGTVTLSGVNLISTATGVVVHKLGSSGTTSVQWAGINLATWAAQVALLGPHLVGILLATNDQSGTSPTPTGRFASNAAALMAVIKTASAAIDRVWIAPPENVRGSAPLVRMEQYTEAVLGAAIDNSFPLHDLQWDFGDDPAEYAFGTTLAYLDSSNLHPSSTSGGPVIADAVTRLLAPVR